MTERPRRPIQPIRPTTSLDLVFFSHFVNLQINSTKFSFRQQTYIHTHIHTYTNFNLIYIDKNFLSFSLFLLQFKLTSCWLSIGPVPQNPDYRLWWWCDRYCRPRAPHSWRCVSLRRRSDVFRLFWCRPCQWCSQSNHSTLSSHAAAVVPDSHWPYAAASQPRQPELR